MRSTKYNSLFMISIVLSCLASHVSRASVFESQWGEVNDRIWLGAEYWANPMEDWRIQDGRVECITGGPNRNVHVLVCELDSEPAEFTMSVRCGRLGTEALAGSVGFRVGITDEINDYRARCIKGKGIDIGLNHLGKLFIGNQTIVNKNFTDSRFLFPLFYHY